MHMPIDTRHVHMLCGGFDSKEDRIQLKLDHSKLCSKHRDKYGILRRLKYLTRQGRHTRFQKFA
jgi:hypothetical protein